MGEGVLPIIGVIDPSNPAQGSSVTVNVNVQPPATAGTLTLVGSPAGFFSSLPKEVPVPAGANQVTFQAVVSMSAVGTGTIEIDGGLGQVEAQCTAQPT